jgi:CheY-like chemotaxis protein
MNSLVPTILVADHEPAISEVVSGILEADGYAIKVASSSEQALQLGALFKPQLLVIEPIMPGISGVEVATRLSRETSCKVLFLTTLADDSDFREMVRGLQRQGCDSGTLSKPFKRQELLDHVHKRIGAPMASDSPSSTREPGSAVEIVEQRETDSSIQDQETGLHNGLLEIATVNLYQTNAFRITGLDVDSSLREVTKEAEKLEMMLKLGRTPTSNGIFPLSEAPTVESVKKALQLLKDPEGRLVQEMFWFWHCSGDGKNDPALQAMRQQQYKTAVDIWTKTIDSGNGIAIHNLAVFYHLGALDSAVRRSNSQQPTSTEEIYLWSSAYRYWKALIDRTDFWNALIERIRSINDPRLRLETSKRIWVTLPNAIIGINAQMAVAAGERGDFEEAAIHRKIMYTSGFGEGVAILETQRALSHIQQDLERLCENAEKEGRSNPNGAYTTARKLLHDKNKLLRIFNYLLGVGNPMCDAAHDRVAEAARSCIVAYVNETEDWAGARSVSEECLALAEGKALRLKLEEDLEIIGRNLVGQQQSQSPPQSNRTSAVDATPRTGKASPTPAADIAATPPGYMLVQASDGGLHHIPIANIEKARSIDPKLTILHVEPARTNESAAPQASATAPNNTSRLSEAAAAKAQKRNRYVAAIFAGMVILFAAVKGCYDSSGPATPASSQGVTQATPSEPASQSFPSSTAYTPQPNPNWVPRSTTEMDALKSEIDSDSKTLDTLESELKVVHSNVDQYDSLLKIDKNSLDRMKRDNDAGIDIDENLYETTRQRFNANVDEHNRSLAEYKNKLAQYNQLLAATNQKIDRYNSQRGTR